MQTATYPMYARRHAGFTDTLLIDQEVDGVWEPLDLTGYAARLQVRVADADTAQLLATLDTATTGITIDGPAGTISLHIPDTLTGLIPAGRWFYDLRLVPPTGDADYLINGPFYMEASVTTP